MYVNAVFSCSNTSINTDTTLIHNESKKQNKKNHPSKKISLEKKTQETKKQTNKLYQMNTNAIISCNTTTKSIASRRLKHNERAKKLEKKPPTKKSQLYCNASGPSYTGRPGSSMAGSGSVAGSAGSVDFRLGRSCTRTVSAECIN